MFRCLMFMTSIFSPPIVFLLTRTLTRAAVVFFPVSVNMTRRHFSCRGVPCKVKFLPSVALSASRYMYTAWYVYSCLLLGATGSMHKVVSILSPFKRGTGEYIDQCLQGKVVGSLLSSFAKWCQWNKIELHMYRSLVEVFSLLTYIPIHQTNPASTGEISSDISFPYKHNPASVLSISRDPRPASFTSSFIISFSHSSTALEDGTEI